MSNTTAIGASESIGANLIENPPVDGMVRAEMARIKQLSFGDKGDLISYAREIVALRRAVRDLAFF